MTLQITSVQSAEYNEHSEVLFTVTCGTITNVQTFIFNRPQDRYNDTILKDWLADSNNTVSAYVTDPVPVAESVADTRRRERQYLFSYTIDLMNPVWYNKLTSTQQTNLATWRQAWLDYPTDNDATEPVLPEGIFN